MLEQEKKKREDEEAL